MNCAFITLYERDIESDLDFAQARYYSNQHGRFTSPDDFSNDSDTSDPQSWNLYAYVRNNPLVFIDPTGMITTDLIDSQTGERTHIDDDLKDQVITASSKEIKMFKEKFGSDREFYYKQLRVFENSKNNLNMTSAQLDNLAGVIYAEASVKANNWGESAGIYGVLKNRAVADGNSVLDQANDTSQVKGALRKDEIFSTNAPESKVNSVYKGIAISVATGRDYSNGGYYWQGTDFNGPNSKPLAYEKFYLRGFRFTSSSDNIWGMKDYPTKAAYKYTYESTAAYGQTIFMRLTEAWMKANGAKNWRGGRR